MDTIRIHKDGPSGGGHTLCELQEIASVATTPDQSEAPGVDAVAGGWVLGTILTKQDVQPWGTTTTTRQIIGYQFVSSKAEAVGQFVAMTQDRNPGFSLGEIISLELPPAAGQAPNDRHQPRGT